MKDCDIVRMYLKAKVILDKLGFEIDSVHGEFIVRSKVLQVPIGRFHSAEAVYSFADGMKLERDLSDERNAKRKAKKKGKKKKGT